MVCWQIGVNTRRNYHIIKPSHRLLVHDVCRINPHGNRELVPSNSPGSTWEFIHPFTCGVPLARLFRYIQHHTTWHSCQQTLNVLHMHTQPLHFLTFPATIFFSWMQRQNPEQCFLWRYLLLAYSQAFNKVYTLYRISPTDAKCSPIYKRNFTVSILPSANITSFETVTQ